MYQLVYLSILFQLHEVVNLVQVIQDSSYNFVGGEIMRDRLYSLSAITDANLFSLDLSCTCFNYPFPQTLHNYVL